MNHNQMSLLTPPGESAIQVFCLSKPDKKVKDLVAKHFEPKNQQQSILRLGILKDLKGEILDEIFLEDHDDQLLFHLHGGAMSLFRLKNLLKAWGCVEAEDLPLDNIEDECLWALQRASSKKVTRWALDNLNALPKAKPSPELLASYEFGCSLFEPVRYYLVGESNVGKSSLINRLIGRERVVVDATAGTTRDLIEVEYIVADRKVLLIDAAGLRDTEDQIEKAGQDSLRMALSEGRVLWVVNPHQSIPDCPVENPAALVLTHQDVGEGALVDFDGPVLRTGADDGGQAIKGFIEEDLPAPVGPPFLFTARQLAVFAG